MALGNYIVQIFNHMMLIPYVYTWELISVLKLNKQVMQILSIEILHLEYRML